jgi:hypothetical protein
VKSVVVRKILSAMVVSESEVDGKVALCFYSREPVNHETQVYTSAPNVCAQCHAAILRMTLKRHLEDCACQEVDQE